MSTVDDATHLTTAVKSPKSSTHSQSAQAQSSAASQAVAPTSSGTATTQPDNTQSDNGQSASAQSNVPNAASADRAETQETRATLNQPHRNLLELTRNDPTIPPEPVITESDAASPIKTSRTSKLPLLAAILKSPRISSRSGVTSPTSPETAQPSQPASALFTGNNGATNETPRTPGPDHFTPSKLSFLAAVKNRGASFKRNSSHSTANELILHEPVSDQAPTLPPFAAQSPMTDHAGGIRPVVAESSVAAPVETPSAAPGPAAQPAASKRPFLSDLKSRRDSLQQRFAKPGASATQQTGTEPIVAQTATVPASTAPPTLVIPTRPPRQPAVSGPALGTKVAKDSFVDSLRNRRIAARQAKYPQGTPQSGSTEQASPPTSAPPNMAPPALVIPTRPPRQTATSQQATGQKSKKNSLVESIKSRKQAAFSTKPTQPPAAQPANPEPNPAQQNTAPPALIIPTRPPRQPAAAARSTSNRLPFLPKKRSSRRVPTSNPAVNSTAYPLPSTNPLFPPLPTYGPPTIKNHIKWTLQQLVATILGTFGMIVLLISFVLRSLFALPTRLVTPRPARPFQAEESRRAELRKADSLAWMKRERQKSSGFPEVSASADVEAAAGVHNGYVPTEGGPDKLVADVGYYARRVGLDSEEVRVQTEDGHVLLLWHIFDPREYTAMTRGQRMVRGPENIDSIRPPSRARKAEDGAGEGAKKKQKYPVLMIHGLLQSAGVFCTNDEHSLAFWLCKQGYDVWLGNMRSGVKPEHIDLKPSDPNMWNWDIRHMATLDLPSLTARVLSETCSPTLALVGHSQGTAASLIAFSTSQRPSLGRHVSVLCCLAPAAYAGPLLHSLRFRVLRSLPRPLARGLVGVKSFLPSLCSLLNTLQPHLPPGWISGLSYAILRLLCGWRDTRWDRGVRDRSFLWAPTRTSATGLLWWLAGGFAAHGSILASRDEVQREVEEDLLQDYFRGVPGHIGEDAAAALMARHVQTPMNLAPWFDDRCPPVALWVPGADDLCSGAALANRFERGREPAARLLGVTVLEGWGHLDVLWAVDVCDAVGREVRDMMWKTVAREERARWRCPEGCEGIEAWRDDRRVEEKPAEEESR
ncbi:unnamed protein product [Diplocarpon coronariae]